MDIDKPAAMQILVARRDNKWVVLRNAIEAGCYAYRAQAMAKACTLATEAADLGLDCHMLLREQDGR